MHLKRVGLFMIAGAALLPLALAIVRSDAGVIRRKCNIHKHGWP